MTRLYSGLSCRAGIAVAIVLLAVGLAAPSTAQPSSIQLKDFLPSSTLFYLDVPSLAQVRSAAETHPFAAMLRNEEVKAFLKPLEQQAEKSVAQLQAQFGMTWEKTLELFGGRLEMAWVGLIGQNGDTRPDFVLRVQITGDPAEARGLVEKLMAMVKEQGTAIEPLRLGEVDGWEIREPFRIAAFLAHDSFFLGTDPQLTEQLAAGRLTTEGEPLDKAETFQAIAHKVNAGQALGSYYLNLARVLELILESAPAGELNQELTAQILDKLGVTSFKGVGGSFSIGPRGITEIIHIQTDPDRKGLLAIMNAMTPGLSLPSRLDRSTVAYTGFKIDFLKAFDTAIEAISGVMEEVSPGELDQLDSFLELAESGAWGFRLRQDLLAALGNEVAVSVGLPRSGSFIPDVLLTAKIQDRKKLESVLQAALNSVPEGQVNVSRIPVGSHTLHVFRIKGQMLSPALALTEDTLVVGMFSLAVKKFLRGYQSTLTQKPVFQDALQAVGLKDLAGVSLLLFADLRSGMSYLYESFSPMLYMIDPAQVPMGLDLAMLPSTEALVKPFSPMIAATRVEKDGFTMVVQGPLGFTAMQILTAAPAMLIGRRVEAMRPRGKAIPSPKRKVKIASKPAQEEKTVEEAQPDHKARLGIQGEDVNGGPGCKVLQLKAGEAAALAGLQVGDIILAVEGQPVKHADGLAALLADRKPGDTIQLKIRRGDQEQMLSVTLSGK